MIDHTGVAVSDFARREGSHKKPAAALLLLDQALVAKASDGGHVPSSTG